MKKIMFLSLFLLSAIVQAQEQKMPINIEDPAKVDVRNQSSNIKTLRDTTQRSLLTERLKTPSSKAIAQMGGSEGTGGGNSMNGRLIESYMVDLTSLPEYENIVRPLLQILRQKSLCTATYIEPYSDRLTWYFVPAKLNTLPQKITGIPVDSLQTAIQNTESHEVWIDLNSYKKLASDEERAKLLLHEIVLSSSVWWPTWAPPYEYYDEIRGVATTRKIVNFVFSKEFTSMDPDEVAEKLHAFGFLTKTEDNLKKCVSTILDLN